MSGAYNSWACGQTKRRECTEGTRVQELDRLKTWVRHPSSSPIYWMNGMAGTGKTTIAFTLCQELDATNELAASFFCTRLLPECRNVQLIIPAVAYQLAQFSRPFRYALSNALAKDQATDKRELGLQLRTLIANPLETVRHTLPARILVVIDALEECEDDDSIGRILDLLAPSATHLPVRFLVSSRPEHQIYRRMMKQVGGNPDAKLVLHELDPDEVKHDIEAYVKRELRDVSLTDEQWKGVLERCGVLFIYASTACRFIELGHRMGSYEEAVNMVLGLSLGGDGGIEKELDKLYTTILETAFNGPLVNQAHRKRMKEILDTIICAQVPMTTEALAGLLELKSAEHANALLQPLFSPVNVAEDTKIAATLHASFPDFMLSRHRSAGFYCAAPEHHIAMTQACLKRIRENPIGDLDERADRAVSPALLYACCHWAAHPELAGQSEDLQKSVVDVLSARLLLWLEVLDVKKCLGQGDEVLKQVVKWCQDARMHKDAVDFACNAFLFHIQFIHFGAPRSTAHIYTSSLPFWLSTDPVAKCYIPRANGILKHQGITIDRRSFPVSAYRRMDEPVNAVCYYPNGAYITAAVGKEIYILDGQTLQIVFGPWEGHTDLVTSIAVSPKGAYIASDSYDATVRVWNSHNGMLVTGPIRVHPGMVTSVAFSPDGTRLVSTAVFSSDGLCIISGNNNQAMCFWDVRTGKLISRQIAEHAGPISSVALSSDGSRLVCASQDGTMAIWDTETHEVVGNPWKAHHGKVNQATFSPDDMYIASCGSDGRTVVWNANSGKLVITGYICIWDIHYAARFDPIRQGSQKGIQSACFSSDGLHIATGRQDGTIWLWDASTGELAMGPLTGHTGYICSVAMSLNGSYITSASSDKTIRLWDINAEGGVFIVLEHHTQRPDSLRFTPEGSQLLYGSTVYSIGPSTFASEGSSRSNDIDTEDEWPKEPPGNDVSCTASSPDGLYVASGDKEGKVQLQHAQTGQMILGPLQGHTKAISQILFSPDGTHMVTCSLDDTIRFWPIPGASSCEVGGSDSTGSNEEANAPPTAIHWKLKGRWGGGWIVNDKGEHLAFVPDYVLPYLLLPENDLLISHHGSFIIDFTNANIGELWTECYQPVGQYCTL
ncbi:WD40-repeat-containing domain protein [Rhizoctonia solani]|nr:WD40-repeat-containing domain protein [Rhizoctonia solani]